MFANRPKQFAPKDSKTMKTKNVSVRPYTQLHITFCKASLKLEGKQTLKIIKVLNGSKKVWFVFFSH